MRKLSAFIKRNMIEMLRDPLALVFCIMFPVVMLIFMQIITLNMEFVPENFMIENYAVGICVFGYSFTGMFVALSITGDKNSSLIKRIEISPVKKSTYFLSYIFSGLPIAACQTILFFLIALIFGLPLSINTLLAFIYLIPSALFYITLGVLLGVVCKNEKQTGPINSIIVTIVGMLGGVFMPISVFGGGFKTFVNILPFCHTVQIASNVYNKGASSIYPHIIFILGYILIIWLITLLILKISDKKTK